MKPLKYSFTPRYLKFAWRNLWRNRFVTIINVTGLGIGLSVTLLITIWVHNELSFDKYHVDAADVFRVTPELQSPPHESWLSEGSPYLLADYTSKQLPEVDEATRLKPIVFSNVVLHYDGKIIAEKKAAYIDAEWFKVFRYDFIDGSPIAFIKNPFSLILTASTAKRYFGFEEPVGKIVRIDTVNYQVQAVIKDNPSNSSFQFNVFIPMSAGLTSPNEKRTSLDWNNFNYVTFLKLKSNANPVALSAKLANILRENKKDNNVGAGLINIEDMHFENNIRNSVFSHGNRTVVNIFIVLVVLILVIACINYVNLTTANASIRSKEVSIRKIIGAGRLHLFGQFMAESFFGSLLSLLLALLIVQLTMPWFKTFTGKEFDGVLLSPYILLILVSTLLVSTLLNGIYPAILLSSFHPLRIFQRRATLNFKDAGLRRILIVVQFTISVVLIIGTVVLFGQLRYIQKINLGYDKSQVFSFTFPYWKISGTDIKKSDAILNTVKQELKQQNSISDVSMASSGIVDFKQQISGAFSWDDKPKDFNPSLSPFMADDNFQRMMDIKIKEGRWFNPEKSDINNVLLNETAVSLLRIRKPAIGQRFVNQGTPGTIIGIVKDFHFKSLHDRIGPMVIINGTGGCFYVKTTVGKVANALMASNKIWKSFFPDDPFDYTFLDESYNSMYKTEQQSSELMTLFASVAILIATFGLLGLVMFSTELRVKEIGIRKVLGASIKNIVFLLSVDFLKIIAIAIVISFPIGWWAMHKYLDNFSYRVSLSWWIFLVAGGIALFIAAIAIGFQSIKAATANPVKSLRSE